jgi:hypothetical protein
MTPAWPVDSLERLSRLPCSGTKLARIIWRGQGGLRVWSVPAQWVFETPVTCHLAMIVNGRLPGMPPFLIAHGAQT